MTTARSPGTTIARVAGSRPSDLRAVLLRLHRYVGLTLAAFLIVIGSTGSVIAFFPELDRWLNPDLITVQPRGERLDMLALRERMQAADPSSHIYAVVWPKSDDESMHAYAEGAIDPKSGRVLPTKYDTVFADPYTGKILGSRLFGNMSLENKDIITFIYYLHYSLVLPEFLGEAFMGGVAALWFVDCLVAFALTLPRRFRGPPPNHGPGDRRAIARRKTFWGQWKSAWLVETRAGTNRLVFDWHRASGLWLFPVLLIFTVSGFAFNLPGVYSSVIGKVSGYTDTDVHPDLDRALVDPAVGWRDALRLTQQYMDQEARQKGFEVYGPYGLYYRRDKGIYVYRVLSSRDISEYAETSVSIDAQTGKLVGVEIPTGDNLGNTFTAWTKSLHQAIAFGFAYRVFVSAVGLLVVVLTITGVLIWWRKTRARMANRDRPAPRAAIRPADAAAAVVSASAVEGTNEPA